MKRLYFQNEQELEKWQTDNNDVWAVYDGKDFICDVRDEDFSYLHSIGFVNDSAEIIPPLTIEQREMFKDSYGIDIIVIDESLKLTSEQISAVRRYNEAVKRLNDANVQCVFSPYDVIVALNGERVQDIMFDEDCNGENDIRVCVDELEVIACPFTLNLLQLDENYFGVRFK